MSVSNIPPLDRKSGIPDATEVPAPERKTTRVPAVFRTRATRFIDKFD